MAHRTKTKVRRRVCAGARWRLLLIATMAVVISWHARPVSAASLPVLDSADFDWKYELDIGPWLQDLDGNGSSDWWEAGAIPVSGGFASPTANNQFYRGDFANSLWRAQFPNSTATDFTIEFSAQILPTGNEGTLGTMGWTATKGQSLAGWLNVKRTGQSWGTGAQVVSLGNDDNTGSQHVFRVARQDGDMWVWRDNMMLNPGGAALTENISIGLGGGNAFFLGNNSGTGHDGDYRMDYFRLQPGAYAPVPEPFRVLASYASGVLPLTGAGGAADPTSQGWTSSGGSNAWADGYDSGDGGWRIVDGTSTDHRWYSHALSAQDVSEMAHYGWTLDFTLSLDSDARNSAGGLVSNYYLPPNHGRQNNQVMWVENEADGYRYIVHFETDEDSNLFAYDQTTWHQLTSDGTAYDDFKSMRITFTDDVATLSFDEQAFVLATAGTPDSNRLVFGASSNGGQGSAIWNHVTLATIPEPGTLILLATALLALLGARRRRR